MTFYDFTIKQLGGQPLDLNGFRGKKVVLVNVASECGFTPQYAELQGLHEEFETQNVVFIGVPCNDFGAQEPGDAEEIQAFCTARFGVTFPLTEKVHAIGPSIHPIYRWLQQETGAAVTWNFQKFLIDETGKPVRSVGPGVAPSDPELTDWLEDGNKSN